MIANKPTIVVCTRQADEALLRELAAGMEEEGVLYELSEETDGDAVTLADGAAERSALGCGIGVYRREAAMQLRGVPAGKPVFRLQNPAPAQCRTLGINSARAIQKKPFRED